MVPTESWHSRGRSSLTKRQRSYEHIEAENRLRWMRMVEMLADRPLSVILDEVLEQRIVAMMTQAGLMDGIGLREDAQIRFSEKCERRPY